MTSGRRGLSGPILLTFGLLIAAVLVTSTAMILVFREREIKTWSATLDSMSTVLAGETEQALLTAQIGLDVIVARLVELGSTSATGPNAPIESAPLRRVIAETIARTPLIDNAAVVFADGSVISVWPQHFLPKVTAAERETLEQGLATGTMPLYISAPIQDSDYEQWIFYVGRAFKTASGAYGGMALVGISVDRLSAVYRRLGSTLAPQSTITLLRDDFTLMTRWPNPSGLVGQQLLTGTTQQVIKEMNLKHAVIYSGDPRPAEPTSSIPRLAAVRALEWFPLIVNLTIPQESMLVNWGNASRLIIGISAGCIAALLIAMYFLMRNARLRALSDEAQRIAAVAFDTMDGVMIMDADQVILRANPAFTRITGYSAAEAIGHRPPELLGSDRHDSAFFDLINEALISRRRWQGEIWNRHKNGTIYPVRISISAVSDANGVVTHYVSTFVDDTPAKQAAEQIEHLASFDTLTQLPNRRLLREQLQHALAVSARTHRFGALLLIDLDNFRTLNDTLGHEAGDLLLQQVALRFAGCMLKDGTLARIGGDEFVLLIEDLSDDLSEAAVLAESAANRIQASLAEHFVIAGASCTTSPSIGIVLLSGHRADTTDELLKQAEIAMYQAKSAGRNTLRFFDSQMQEIVAKRAFMESLLRTAVDLRQFELHFQPQVDRARRVVGAEALLRLRHPTQGLIMPGEFIVVAEDTGLIIPIGEWVLNQACDQLARWAASPVTAELTLAINVSALQFHRTDFAQQVFAALERSGASPQKLKIEPTESVLLDDTDKTITTMTLLRERGVRFSLDDFGTGYSSLAYLQKLPIDQLKIDKSFVQNLPDDENSGKIARAIIALCNSLGLSVIAEGVETRAQLQFLEDSGCEYFQGYLFGAAAPIDEFEKRLG